MCLTNDVSTTTFITIYELEARIDSTVKDPLKFWADGVAKNTRAKSYNSDEASVAYQDYRATPYLSPSFCESYEIKQSYNIELAQGRTHIHDSTYFLNRLQRSDRTILSDGTMADLTMLILIVIQGSPVCAPSPQPPAVSSSAAAINILHDYDITFSLPEDNDKTYYNNNTLPTFTFERFQNIATGAKDIESTTLPD